MNDKKFDAVELQRRLRDELSRKFMADRDAFFKELKKFTAAHPKPEQGKENKPAVNKSQQLR